MVKEDYYHFGYEKLGPLLWGYSHWLMDNFKERGVKKVYFFSRDGLIMRKAFHLLNGSEEFEDYYLEVSRRSLRVPILWKDPSLENLLTMLSPSGLISIRSVFDGVGLDIAGYTQVLEKYGFSNETAFYRNEMLDNQKLLALYDSLLPDIIQKSKEEFVLLQKYIKQNNLHGKFAIVDIGWSGGMQRFLQETLDVLQIPNEIYGFYTGIADYFKRNTSKKKLELNGYLFDFSKNSNDVDLRSSFVGLYELLFLETAGSVKNYKIESDKVVACRYPYEYECDGEVMEEVKLIEFVQTAALQFIRDQESYNQVPSDKMELCKSLILAGTRPTKDAMKLFANFRFYDEGVFNYLAKPHKLFFYLLHPATFKKDLYLSRWKTAFLRKVFILPISYFKFYKYLKKISR